MSAAPLLDMADVHTYYGLVYVLQGVSLTAEAGRVTAVLGRNGVGKTTLMRTLIGFTPPRRGRIAFAGTDITAWPPYRIARSGVALVPQGRRIFPSVSVREHLDIARSAVAGRRTSPTWDVERIFALFPRLHERAENRAGTLSGGEQQMLAVARALINNPRLVLMDEPTEGLSPFMVDDLKRLIATLRAEDVGVLLVEQNLDFALSVADRVYIMERGRIVREAAPEEVRDDDTTKAYLGL